jgi:DNA-binding transcriptional MerR regulator
MLIGELSRRSGLSRDTIRFYEKELLIRPRKPARKEIASNNYKDYPESAVSDLRFIQRTKVLGFTLAEIRDMLTVRGQGQPSKKWAAEAEAKLRDVDRKILELREVRGLLAEALQRCSDRCFDAGCDLLDGALARKRASGSPRGPERRICPPDVTC